MIQKNNSMFIDISSFVGKGKRSKCHEWVHVLEQGPSQLDKKVPLFKCSHD